MVPVVRVPAGAVMPAEEVAAVAAVAVTADLPLAVVAAASAVLPAAAVVIALPVRVTASTEELARGVVAVENRADFRDLDWLVATWDLSDEHGSIARGKVLLPALGPTATGHATLEGWPALHASTLERWMTIAFLTAGAEPWAPAAFPVGEIQLQVSGLDPILGASHRRPNRSIVGPDGSLRLPALADGPRLALWRAPTDNDRIAGLAEAWSVLGLDRLERRLEAIEEDAEALLIRSTWLTGSGLEIPHEQRISVGDDGSVHIAEAVTIPTALADLARVGTVLEFEPGHEALTWYGRGPVETYPDRRRAGGIGRWESSVTAQFVPYIRPQENGGHADTRWLELRRASGGGARIELDRPSQVSISHLRAADLATATHVEELIMRPETIVRLDAAHRGLGTASCGPDTLAPFVVSSGQYRWSWSLISLAEST